LTRLRNNLFERAPWVYAWTEALDDLSGYETFEGDWLTPDEIPDTLVSILDEVGRIYISYLLAIADKQDVLRVELDDKPWQQHPFTYQAKCLQ